MHMLLLDRLMSIMYRLALVLSIMHLIMRKGRCKAIFMLQILMILATYNICIQTHASATPEIHMPMNNMMGLVNQFETPHVKIFNSIQESVSPFYSSATNLQYVNATLPMDGRIGHATTSYSASYSQPSYATPHVSNFSALYAL